jgi:hypothetical protein
MQRTRHRGLTNGGILPGRIPLISLVQFMAVADVTQTESLGNFRPR